MLTTNQKGSLIHDFVLSSILNCKIKIKRVSKKKFLMGLDNPTVDFIKHEIVIFTCKDVIQYRIGKINFSSQCWVDVESIVNGLKIIGKWIDSYGSILTKDGLLLNNYDSSFEEDSLNPKGFCNIIGFSTISKQGVVRFSQIVYSFKYKRMIIRDDVKYQLPFKPNLEKDFGGKRATYRYGSVLSLRTNLKVYKKTDKIYHQPDRCKDYLSYPRLEIF